MKILIFSHEFPPAPGGAGSVAFVYAKLFRDAGYEVTILTRKSNEERHLEGIKFIEVSTFSKLMWLSYLPIVNSLKFDICILNDMVSVMTASVAFARKKLRKSLMFLHGSEPEIFFSNQSITKSIFFYKYRFCRVLKESYLIVPVSCYMKEKFLKYSGLHSLDDKLKVHISPVDLSIFQPRLDAIGGQLSEYFSDPGRLTLLTVSRVVKQKGFVQKARIFKKLVEIDSKNSWQWIVAGDGPFLPDFRLIVDEMGLGSFVKFIGYRDYEELAFLYSQASAFWLLSNYKESYGLVYKEAQACGCPAIGRNHSGVVETIENESNGFLVDSDDECLDILIKKKFLELDRLGIASAASNSRVTLLDSLGCGRKV